MNSIKTVFPSLTSTWTLATTTWTPDITNAYKLKSSGLPTASAFVWNSTIDLASFKVQDKTFFPRDLRVQSPGLHLCGPDAASWNNLAGVEVMDIISSVPVTETQLLSAILNRKFPGMPDFPLDDQFIMMGKYCAYAADTNLSFPGLINLVKEANFGSGNPTAAEKLYCYRIVVPRSGPAPPLDAATIEIPGTRYEIVGEAEHEDELEYIYRLRQSYEQKQG